MTEADDNIIDPRDMLARKKAAKNAPMLKLEGSSDEDIVAFVTELLGDTDGPDRPYDEPEDG